MSDPTSEEFDAKLTATEASINSNQTFPQFDRLFDRLDSFSKRIDRLSDRVEVSIEQSRLAWQAASSVKWNILFAALGAAALAITVWVLWAQSIQMVGNLLSMKAGGL